MDSLFSLRCYLLLVLEVKAGERSQLSSRLFRLYHFLESIFIVWGKKLKVYFCVALFLAADRCYGLWWKPLCVTHPLLHLSLEHSMCQIIPCPRLAGFRERGNILITDWGTLCQRESVPASPHLTRASLGVRLFPLAWPGLLLFTSQYATVPFAAIFSDIYAVVFANDVNSFPVRPRRLQWLSVG